MSTTDFNEYNQYQEPLANFQLPRIQSLTYKRVKFNPPKLKNFESSLAKYKEAIEIVVVTVSPIPARAAAPVLYIGEIRVDYYVPGKEKNVYIFYAFEFEKIKGKATIKWGWSNDQMNDLKPTGFSYELRGQ